MKTTQAIETAKASYPRLPWHEAHRVDVITVGERVFVICGRHTVSILDGKVEGKTCRATSGTSRKARKF